MAQQREAGAASLRSLPKLRLEPATNAGAVLEQMRSALGRGLPQVRPCRPHQHHLCVLAGGPSLADSYQERRGYLAAVNGSLRWLLERDIVPNACGLLDPGAHMADIIEARPGVNYFVPSICHPSVFEKLTGCHVVLWHPSGQGAETEDLLRMHRPDDWLAIGGGCTMGVRWINLAYTMGFRSFALHGLDSSFRDSATHAYPDRADDRPRLTIGGRKTRMKFIAPIQDFFAVMAPLGQ